MPPTLGDRDLNLAVEPNHGTGMPKPASDSALTQSQLGEGVAKKQNQARESMAVLPSAQETGGGGDALLVPGIAGGLGSPARRARRSLVCFSRPGQCIYVEAIV